MDPKDLFITVGVVLIAIIGGITFIAGLDNNYEGQISQQVDSIKHTQRVLNNSFSSMGVELGDSVNPAEGGGVGEGTINLATRSLRAITALPKLLGIIPTALRDGAVSLGIPETYASIAIIIFIGVFGITIAYLLITGARSLINR
jgi:hypothetical protein